MAIHRESGRSMRVRLVVAVLAWMALVHHGETLAATIDVGDEEKLVNALSAERKAFVAATRDVELVAEAVEEYIPLIALLLAIQFLFAPLVMFQLHVISKKLEGSLRSPGRLTLRPD